MKHLNLFGLVVLIALAGCKPKSTTTTWSPDTHSYLARGVIRELATDHRSVTIQHEAIQGYMAAMTMDFPVRNTNELSGLSRGDVVTFKLVIGTNDDWVEQLHRTGQTGEAATPLQRSEVPELKPGDLMPDADLTTEYGTHLHLSDFRGQTLAFTFFYTSCPLPNYCPRMNKDFSATRDLLRAAPGAGTNWQFLSISFDPNFDTPDILFSYAGLYRGNDSNHWVFAAMPMRTLAGIAPQLDLMILRAGNGITHNLRTVVLDPQGRIQQLFDGYDWTPEQLAKAILAAQQKTR